MIRGTKQITPKKLNYDINFSIHNRFDVEVIDSRTGKIRQKAQAHNVICNGLWECLCSTTAGRYYDKIGYGSGSGTPSVNDTALFHQEGYKQLQSTYDGGLEDSNYILPKYNWDWDTGVVSQTFMVTIPETEIVGVTLTEVGIIPAVSNKLSTHAMLKDMNGNGISIEKTATDIINIYSTVFIHFNPQGYSNGGILMYFHGGYRDFLYDQDVVSKLYYLKTIFSVLFGFMTFKAWVSNLTVVFHHRSISAPDRYPSTDGINYGYTGASAQVSLEEKTLTVVSNRLGAAVGNRAYDGIYAISLRSQGGGSEYNRNFYIQVKENSWYPYTQITGEAVATGDGETKDFALKFPKAHDAKIYVDGVESQATVEYIPHGLAIGYLIPIEKIFPDGSFLPGFTIYDSLSNSPTVFYNPWYEKYGISSINNISSGGTSTPNYVKVSNDLLSWVALNNLTLSSGKYLIPEEYQNYKYWDLTGNVVTVSSASLLNFSGGFTGKAVHFETPPAAGSVITADYKTDTIAKDENHVFDFSLTIHLGEYSGV